MTTERNIEHNDAPNGLPTGPREAKVARAVELLEEGVCGILDSGAFKEYLRFLAAFHRYSPNNSLLIFLQRPDATRVAGYKRWRELGRQVRRGEEGLRIFAPRFRKIRRDEREEAVPAVGAGRARRRRRPPPRPGGRGRAPSRRGRCARPRPPSPWRPRRCGSRPSPSPRGSPPLSGGRPRARRARRRACRSCGGLLPALILPLRVLFGGTPYLRGVRPERREAGHRRAVGSAQGHHVGVGRLVQVIAARES